MNPVRSSTNPDSRAEQSLLLADLDRALGEIDGLVESLAARPEDYVEIAILRSRVLLVRTALNWLGPDRPRTTAPEWEDLLPWRGLFDR